ncbi:MAG: cell division protein FtsA [Prevotella sp.]|nr:cell division protein FtsA [Prevotella sp.]
MAKEFIVAIELGSSKITGIAGKKNLDGSITILSIVQEDSSTYIRRGVIYNIDKTMTALINVKQRLEKQLQTQIRQVYVGVGGQSIISMKNTIVREPGTATIVTQGMVNELMDTNRNMSYPDKEILDAITLEYKVDAQQQIDPVGIQCTRLEGNFLNILWRKTFYDNINNCFKDARVGIADLYIAPLALAESVLVEADRRAGCLLVDLGAGTTTVSVYYRNILRHLAVLPLGAMNITHDIASLQMEESEAEKLKLHYGSAYTEAAEIDPELSYPLADGRSVASAKFIDLVEARVEEIVENVWAQVPAEYTGRLLGGIILTGGGANLRNIEKVFRDRTHINKIRIAKSINRTVDGTQPEVTAEDCRLCTALSLLVKGDMNCAGSPITTGLFSAKGDERADSDDTGGQDQHLSDITPGRGKVMTPEEKQRKEEEERQRKEEEERKRREEEEERRRREEEEKKRNSPIRKFGRKIKGFFDKMISEDE